MTLIEELQAWLAAVPDAWSFNGDRTALQRAINLVKKRLPDIIAEERDACAQIAWKMQMEQFGGGTAIGNAISASANRGTPAEPEVSPVHYAPYGKLENSQYRCGASDGEWTGMPDRVTCNECKKLSPGLWPTPNRLQEAERLCRESQTYRHQPYVTEALLLVIEELRDRSKT